MAVPPTDPKGGLRAEALARRSAFVRELDPASRGALERQLAAIVLPRLPANGVIGCYHPMRDEVSPLPIVVASTADIAFPWFAARDAVMAFRLGTATEPGPWGILQPSTDSPLTAPAVVLVPLVLADRAGNRIGHGKGHYDRALDNLRASRRVRTIGLAWPIQISDTPLNPDPWDVPSTPLRHLMNGLPADE